MDQNTLKNLTPQQAERFAKLERLFGQPGWKLIEEWARNNAQEQFNRAAVAQTWDQNRIATGARLAYIQVLSLAEATVNEFEQLAEQAKSAKEAVEVAQSEHEAE